MCIYSYVADQWRSPWSPNYIPLPAFPKQPATLLPLPDVTITTTVTPDKVTPDVAALMLEILKKLDELDKKVGLQDCKLNEKDKQAYQDQLKKIAGAAAEECPCKNKVVKKGGPKRKGHVVKKVLLQE